MGPSPNSGYLITFKEMEHRAGEEGVQGHERILSAEMSEQFLCGALAVIAPGEDLPQVKS